MFMKFWSKSWKSSKNPGKQRKYAYNAPLNIKRKFLSATLSDELRKKYKRRSFTLKKGDEIEVMRGEFKKKRGKINKINVKDTKVYMDGITRKKVDGTDISVPIHPSNLRIIELDLKDEKRLKALNRTIERKENGKERSKKTVSAKVLEGRKKEN